MAIYDMRRSTATPVPVLLALRLVDLALRIAEWQAARRTRKLFGGLDGHLLKDAGLRRDDLGRF